MQPTSGALLLDIISAYTYEFAEITVRKNMYIQFSLCICTTVAPPLSFTLNMTVIVYAAVSGAIKAP